MRADGDRNALLHQADAVAAASLQGSSEGDLNGHPVAIPAGARGIADIGHPVDVGPGVLIDDHIQYMRLRGACADIADPVPGGRRAVAN